MKVNFKLIQHCALELDGVYLDLHNNFNFSEYSYCIAERHFKMVWTRSAGAWVKPEIPVALTLIVTEVDYLLITPRDNEYPFTEDTCMMAIAYSPASEREDNELLFTQEMPGEDDDLLVVFQNEQVIRVHGATIDCKIS